MGKLLLSVALASLIAAPCAFAHGKASTHGRTHASARHRGHIGHRFNRDSKSADRIPAAGQANIAAADQGNPSRSVRGSAKRHVDEEELAIDELAATAN